MSRASQPMVPCVLKEPRQITVDSPVQVVDVAYSGLTIREYFAAMAMQGFCARKFDQGEPSEQNIAGWAVVQADALIAELAK